MGEGQPQPCCHVPTTGHPTARPDNRTRGWDFVCDEGFGKSSHLKSFWGRKKKKEEHNNTPLLFHKHARDHFLWITPLTQPGHHYISDQKNCHSGVTPVPAGTASLRAARARSASCLTHWGLLGQRAWAELTAPRCGKGKRWGQNDVKSLKSASFGPTSSHQNISKRQLVTCNGSPRYL